MLAEEIILGFTFLFFCGFSVFLLDRLFGDYDFLTSRLAAGEIAKIILAYHVQTANFCDLGSCRGVLVANLARKLPSLHIYGVDKSFLRTVVAKTRTLFFKNVSLKRQNIFLANISSMDVIYIYLSQDLLPRLQEKLLRELKPGSLVITNSVSFPNWQATETHILHKNKPNFEKIFVYKMP